MENNSGLLIAALVLAGTIYQAWSSRKSAAFQAYDELITKLREEILRVEKTAARDMQNLHIRIAKLEEINQELSKVHAQEANTTQFYREGAWKLWRQLSELSHEPVFNPAMRPGMND